MFYLSGQYTNAAGNKTRIMVPITDDVMFKTQQDSITVAAGVATDFTGVVQIYLDKLLTDISSTNLDNATLTNGNIVISSTSNTALYYLIRRNLFMDHGCRHEKGMRHGH